MFVGANTILGRMQTQKVCPECNGTGQEFEEKCQIVTVKVLKTKVTIKVKVPAGVDNDQQIRLAARWTRCCGGQQVIICGI